MGFADGSEQTSAGACDQAVARAAGGQVRPASAEGAIFRARQAAGSARPSGGPSGQTASPGKEHTQALRELTQTKAGRPTLTQSATEDNNAGPSHPRTHLRHRDRPALQLVSDCWTADDVARDAADARTEFWISLAGPVASVAIGTAALGLASLLGWTRSDRSAARREGRADRDVNAPPPLAVAQPDRCGSTTSKTP